MVTVRSEAPIESPGSFVVTEPAEPSAESVRAVWSVGGQVAEAITTAPDEPDAVEDFPVPAQPRLLPTLPVSVPVAPLTEASPEYVSEPVEPQTPFRGVTEFDRLAAQYEQLDVAAAMSLLGGGLGDLGGLSGGLASVAEPAPVPTAEPPTETAGRPAHRRPNLAESRRRGINVASIESDEPYASDVDDAPVPPAAAAPPEPMLLAPAPAPAAVAPEPVWRRETPPAGPGPAEPTESPTTAVSSAVAAAEAPSMLGPDSTAFPRVSVPPEPDPSEASAAPDVKLPRGVPAQPRTTLAPLWPRPAHRRTAPASVPPRTPEPTGDGSTESAIAERVADASDVSAEPSTTEEPAPRAPIPEPPAPAGPVYRAVLDERMAPPPPADSTALPDTVIVPVPGELVTLFSRELGVDVSSVPVHRGRAVAARARQLDARAYAQAGQVFLPHHAGDVAEPPVRALLAHELTHAVQQRILGDTQPTPESAEGRELEAAAGLVEHWVAGSGPRPPALLHRNASSRLDPGRPDPGRPPGSIVQSAEAAVAVPAEPPPAEPPAPAGALAPVSWSWETGFTGGPPAGGPPPVPGGLAPGGLLPGGPMPATEPDTAVATAFEQLADLRASVIELRNREPEPRPVIDLNDLASRLYQHIRSRLRAELIIDRERAGMLADLR
ncbi:DUF4157 domain-containing protein [Amycolatopsis sp. NBC_01488]|uniref:eCIS core domain-containing protein n=1 Tax=Amycolatopsis sp. NBC_01488 TaxID=2903563 RepID=UPI002E2E14F2|nr:DUF4157 domain-containing protein [Amycolatopsis sp. NBC_01488]